MNRKEFILGGSLLIFSGCATLPIVEHEVFTFPAEQAFINEPDQPYEKMGVVKSKVDFSSLDPEKEEDYLCKNYYHKSVRELVSIGKKQGADAVMSVRSVVFYMDGTSSLSEKPECSDDGESAQALTQGIAIKWKTKKQKGEKK